MVAERTLSELIAGQEGWTLSGDPATPVRSISSDSRRVEPGALFVAIRGERSDGHAHIADAIANGAAAVALERFPPSAHLTGGGPLATLLVPDSRAALAELSAAFYGHPSERLALYGVTGTNGKTTVTHLVESLFARSGDATGLIGTIEHRYAGRREAAANTTPESVDLQRLLAEMVEAGVRRAVMEVSSHALALHRALACNFRGAVFTNLSQDHLDFHGDMDAYYEAKERLFRSILPRSRREPFAAVNADDPRAEGLVRAVPGHVRVLRFSLSKPVEVRALESEAGLGGVRARIATPVGEVRLASPLGGLYNLSNLLAAAAVGAAEGMSPDAIRRGLEAVDRVPGRFERVGGGVIVDYAHTPDALDNLLRAARGLCSGRLIAVFGCGGDRDRGKRPLMGEAV
ncbi:MAG: UDP-N-acetylmuramoyl-L-alanyl-D-glutamate--2,6-diaminopimelate ligase, partial [Candidatus Methylomirabilis sp.]|nr:UDP-N-acetylmuramoyl-L-alanyl-D-glutamate--2,6-diaminopimelate ligase [Deltaproteobacteria bacterium]